MEITSSLEDRCDELRQEIMELEGLLELYGCNSSDHDEQRAISRIQTVIVQRKALLSRFEIN